MRFSNLITRLGAIRASRKRLVIASLVLVAVIVAASAITASLQSAHSPAGIIGSGFIEAEEVSISSLGTGRIVEVAVEEGDEVEEGELLVRLDSTQLDAQVEAAQAAVAVAEANLEQAQVTYDVTYLQWKSAVGRRSHAEAITLERQLRTYKAAVETAQARVEQAKAELAVVETQREQLTVRSPVAGVVTQRVANVGEVVSLYSTTPLVVVTNLDVLTLVMYIPESKLGLINLGQEVEISVDSFPGEVFLGEVSYISSQAEFTPTGVQTQEERVKMVFRIKVTIPNPEHRLKPGMPADAVILLEAESD